MPRPLLEKIEFYPCGCGRLDLEGVETSVAGLLQALGVVLVGSNLFQQPLR
jgi:hypothetical protein